MNHLQPVDSDLLLWSSALDFTNYHREWMTMATSGASNDASSFDIFSKPSDNQLAFAGASSETVISNVPSQQQRPYSGRQVQDLMLKYNLKQKSLDDLTMSMEQQVGIECNGVP